MITTATYLLVAKIEGEEYHFQYEHCYDVWACLEKFWHEDYPEMLIEQSSLFPVTVKSMHQSKVIATYDFMFNAGVFHAFFDHGHTVNGPYTLDQFAKDIERKPEPPKHVSNDLTSFFYYMWNRWNKDECRIAFEDNFWPHFWSKWCGYCENYTRFGAVEEFYASLTDHNRDRLVRRALEVYNGNDEK